MDDNDEIRWELGEAVWNRGAWYTPLGFILVHAAVLAWMHLRRAISGRLGAAKRDARGSSSA